MRWQEHDGVKWLVASMDGARVAFSTRRGGVSTGSFEGLNLGFLTDDEPAAVSENRTRLARVLRLDPSSIPIARQVHGNRIIRHSGPQDPSPYAAPGSDLPEADGHIVAEPGLAPLVFVADCLPVALRGPGGLAMLHCGWRPLAAGIIAAGAEVVGATEAVVGPGIGPCCYEVGPEVLEPFAALGDGIADGRMLDLAEVARRLLREAGVERVQSAGLCTSCNPELFFSHRRDAGTTGRQAGLAWLTPTRFPGEA
ncbi:MAG TPA: polyphenol oxidase family protein [Solirubrobacterales bacterium]|nr:polyphenol oxidase family protein [Solirubrobacterales bacterium]